MKIYVANSFSLSMLNRELQSRHDNESGLYGHKRQPRPVDPMEFLAEHLAAALLSADIVSIIGHEDTAAVFSAVLGIPLKTNRQAIQLDAGGRRDYDSCVLVGQVMSANGGPYRLPTGATELPEDATIEWWVV